MQELSERVLLSIPEPEASDDSNLPPLSSGSKGKEQEYPQTISRRRPRIPSIPSFEPEPEDQGEQLQGTMEEELDLYPDYEDPYQDHSDYDYYQSDSDRKSYTSNNEISEELSPPEHNLQR